MAILPAGQRRDTKSIFELACCSVLLDQTKKVGAMKCEERKDGVKFEVSCNHKPDLEASGKTHVTLQPSAGIYPHRDSARERDLQSRGALKHVYSHLVATTFPFFYINLLRSHDNLRDTNNDTDINTSREITPSFGQDG